MATHVDQCKMLRLPIGKPLDYNDLSTARLRALSSFAGHGDSGTTDRSALLISLSNDVRAEAGNPWTIQNAQVIQKRFFASASTPRRRPRPHELRLLCVTGRCARTYVWGDVLL